MIIFDIYKKYKFCISTDRIGPDIPFTHWLLHFQGSMRRLCQKKFKFFGANSDFRPGAYAVSCFNISIGNNVVVRPTTMLFADEYAQIIIKDDVMIGAGVHFYVNNHRFDRIDVPLIEQGYYPSKRVLIKEGSWIGANSIILPGVTVGVNAVIGAGSIVTKSIPDYAVAVGSPAKVIKFIGY